MKVIKKNQKFILVSLTLIFMVGVSIYLRDFAKKRYKKNYQIYYESSFNDELMKLKVSAGVNYFTLANGDKFGANLNSCKYNGRYYIFMNTAEVGDGVMKKANSSSMVLIKGERKYIFIASDSI